MTWASAGVDSLGRTLVTLQRIGNFSDHLGSASVITNATGVMPPQEESDYYPYGGEIVFTNGDPNQYKFTGKERDAESGLDDFEARHYSSSLGRFMQPDEFTGGPVDLFDPSPEDPSALPYAEITNPQSLNKYNYTYNNPLRYVDPNGHDAWDFLGGIANAAGSDFFGGAGRQDSSNADFQAGQNVGDALAMVGGTQEVFNGAGTFVLGTMADAAGGAGIPLQGVGALEMVQGGTAVEIGGAHLMAAAKRVGDFTPSDKEQLDQDNANKNGGQNKCTECGRDVQKVQNKKGEPTPGNQLQRHHDPMLSKGGHSKSPKNRIVCKDCHVKIHKKLQRPAGK